MQRDTIDICDKFNLIDIRVKCPYSTELLDDEAINKAMKDLKRCFVVCDSTPEVYMFKDYDAITERPKVSYTSEAIAKQKLKKIVIGNKLINLKPKPYSLWDVFIENQLQFTVKALKFFSEDEQIFSFFRGYDYKQLDEVKEEVIQPFLTHIHDVIANKNEEVYKYIR